MKKSFYASVCSNGAQGGGLYLTDDGVAFKCQKLTVDERYKCLLLRYEEIENAAKCRAIAVFPSILITMRDKTRHKFIVFNRRRFLKILSERLP